MVNPMEISGIKKDNETPKPDFEEWLYWANVVVDRLTTCVHVYSKPPHEDIFMPEKDRQHRNGQTINLLKRIHALIDETETPSDSLEELDHHAERVIDGVALLFKETLDHLPELSIDMQKLLKSPWQNNCNGRIAEELFRGPAGNEREGIGSGMPEHGRLPEVLVTMLESEQTGDNRSPRQEAMGHAPMRRDKTSERWSERNSRMLRSAGRIE